MTKLPFSLSKHSNGVYYVQFKNTETNSFLSAKSTKQKNIKDAERAAWEMYRKGMSGGHEDEESLAAKSFRDTVRRADISDNELDYVVREAVRRGKIRSVVYAGSVSDIPAYEFMVKFWDWEKSEYIAEKKRKAHSITMKHCKKQGGYIRNYWKDFLGVKVLGELTKHDILRFVDAAADLDISFSSKNDMIRAGTTALKWAYNRELIERDITTGIVFFSGKQGERAILTRELARAVFSVEWNDPRAKLANMLAMCTGMRSGEIRGLRLRDIGENCVYVNHSWNDMEGLKCPKNGETRTVYQPFPQITELLRQLGEHNHFGQGLDAFIFESTVPWKPMEASIFVDELRAALVKTGLNAESAKQYTFHAWRHFFVAYMSDHVNERILRRQTGHKTPLMLKHYANHEISGDAEIVEATQIETFGKFMDGGTQEIDYDKIQHYVKCEWK